MLPAISLGLWNNFGADRPARDEPRDRPPSVRSRRHALRPREQLRAALRLGRGDVRAASGVRSRAVPRRARDLDEGRLRHVARAVRRVGLAEVPPREPRPEPPSHRARLRRHLLLAPVRPRDAARGDDGRARHAPSGRGRRSTRESRRTRPSARARRQRSSTGLGTPLLIHQPSYSMLNRWIEDGLLDDARRARRRLHRLLAARPGAPHRPLRERHPGGLAHRAGALPARGPADGADEGEGPRARARSPPRGARRSPRWRSRGRCATRA